MSADDATARWLDEQVDLALANGGTLPPELADTELGEVVQLFAADAAALAAEEMPDASGVRRRLLEQVGDEQAAGAGLIGSVLRGTGRSAGWSAGRAWRARRVVMVAGCMVVLCTTLAYADTKTPAGRAVRAAARTLQIPVPAETKHHAKPARGGADERTGGGNERRGDEARGDEQDAREPILGPDGEPVLGADGEPMFQPEGERGDMPRDGQFEPGEQPMPPMGEQPREGSRPTVPPTAGTAPTPKPQPNPNPDGSKPMPPPVGIEPKPLPKPPAGQQPPPPAVTTPPPNGTRPPAPKPGGQPPLPGATQPAPQPQPAPVPQPKP